MKKKLILGMTIVEVLISSTLVLIILSVVTSFLWNYYYKSNRIIEQEQLRNSLSAVASMIEKEILPGAEVVYTNGSFTTGKNTLILSVPSFDKNGIPLFDPSTMQRKNDLIIIYKENDGKQINRKYGGLKLKLGRLKLKIITSTGSARKAIFSQTLFSDLSPYDGSGQYILPTRVLTIGMFNYFSANKVEMNPTFPKDIALIKTTLWGESEYGKTYLSELFELELKLRNISDND